MHAHTPWLAHLMDRFALYSKNIPRGKGPYNCFLPSELWQALVHNCCLLLPPSSPSCSSSSVSTCYSYFNLLFLILHLIFPLPALMWSFSNATLFFFFFLEDVIGSSYSWYWKNSCLEHQTTGLTSNSAPVYSFGSIILPLWPTNTADCIVESYSSHKSYI